MRALQQCRCCGGQFAIEMKQGELIQLVCNTCLAKAEDHQKMAEFVKQGEEAIAQIRTGYLSPHE
jgi:uncharacterized protein (UPF0303 family)